MATHDAQISPAPEDRRLLKEQKWRQILAEQQGSGMRQTEFCRQKGIPLRQLRWWKRQILIRDGKSTPGATRKSQRGTRRTPALVPVRISTEPSAPSTFELVFRGNDRVLRIPSQFDEARLTALLGVLHKTC